MCYTLIQFECICPAEIGSYRKSSIKRRGAYCIFHVKSAALIREGRLFQLRYGFDVFLYQAL